LNIFVTVVLVGITLCGDVMASQTTDPMTIVLYEIHGTNLRELRADLNRLAPLDPIDGHRYDGLSQWHVLSAIKLESKGDECWVRSFDTTLKFTMTLPTWVKPLRATTLLAEQWSAYSEALRLHENGHYSIAVAAAEKLKQASMRDRSSKGCDALQKDLEVTSSDVIGEYNRLDEDYDVKTKHGQTQGVQFPGQ
jgi:predicted secreted Zn-dependent protease